MTVPVSLCIPAYRAEEFIGRTLACARAQTHQDLRILVSIDGSEDATEAICRRVEAADDRVRVAVQRGRLGWSRNTNAALDMAATDHVAVYFHDDVIEPTYVERLVDALAARPDAASAHCDLVEFGLVEDRKPAHAYEGPPVRRVVDYLMTQRGTTLRSLVRRSVAGDLRFPEIHGDSHWSAFGFHVELVAAGPALAVHEPLYRRWQRQGSLTRSAGWIPPTLDDLLQGQQESFETTCEVLRQRLPDPVDRDVAIEALRLFHRTFVRRMQARLDNDEELPPRLDRAAGLADRAALDAETRRLLQAGERRLLELEGRDR